MTNIQLLQLLKNEIADFYFEDADGRCKSTLSALELIEIFREQILEDFKKNTALQNNDL